MDIVGKECEHIWEVIRSSSPIRPFAICAKCGATKPVYDPIDVDGIGKA